MTETNGEFATQDQRRMLHRVMGELTLVQTGCFQAVCAPSSATQALDRIFGSSPEWIVTNYELRAVQTPDFCPPPEARIPSCTLLMVRQNLRNFTGAAHVIAQYNFYLEPTRDDPEHHRFERVMRWPEGSLPPSEMGRPTWPVARANPMRMGEPVGVPLPEAAALIHCFGQHLPGATPPGA